MRSSKGFNSRQMRVVRDFCLSNIADGQVSLLFLADRAQNAEAQEARVRSGRRQFDRFEIEMTEDEARRLYAFLHRKFQGAELAREAVRGVAEGFGRGVAAALFGSAADITKQNQENLRKRAELTSSFAKERVIEHARPVVIPRPDEETAGLW